MSEPAPHDATASVEPPLSSPADAGTSADGADRPDDSAGAGDPAAPGDPPDAADSAGDLAASADRSGAGDPSCPGEPSDLAARLDAVTAERDDYLDQLQRQRAEFQNYRRRMTAERQQQVAAGVSRLVETLLPVLDACDAAAAQGHREVTVVGQALMVALGKAGLERIDAVGQPFDPTQHEAVTITQAPGTSASGTPASGTGESGTPASGTGASGTPASGADPDDSEPASDADRDSAESPTEGPADGPADGPAADAEATDDSLTPSRGAAATEPEHAPGGGEAEVSDRQIVTEELRSGFRFEGRVLRAAMVNVRAG